MPPNRVVLIHGAATTAAVWTDVRKALAASCPEAEVLAPQRAYSGDLATEVDALADVCAQAVVVGVSGGATLGLALLAAGVPLAGAVLHEPAVGSLAPGLLAPVAAAYEAEGVAGFGAALYGPAWNPAMAPDDPQAVRRDLAMFRAFEPEPPRLPESSSPDAHVPDTHVNVTTTVGARSLPVRYQAAEALRIRFGLPYQILDGCGHAAHLERPDLLAALAGRFLPG